MEVTMVAQEKRNIELEFFLLVKKILRVFFLFFLD